MGDNVKNLTKVEVNNIHYSPLTHQASHLMVESCQVGWAWLLWLPLCKSMLTTPRHLLRVFGNGFQNCWNPSPSLTIKVRLVVLYFHGSFLSSLLKIGLIFGFLKCMFPFSRQWRTGLSPFWGLRIWWEDFSFNDRLTWYQVAPESWHDAVVGLGQELP